MCRALGMQGSQLFESADLVNGKYTSSIVTNLKTLQEIHARYSKLSPGSGSSASSTAGTASPRAANTTSNTSAPSTPRAASGSVSAGSPRVDASSSQNNTPAGKQPATPRKSEAIALSIPSTPDNVVRARDTKPKPDDDRVAIVQHWLEEVVGKKNTEESLFAWLKSGVILSEVLNVVKPGICKQIYEGPVAFKQLENVQRYLKLVPLAAGPTVPIFSPADLADEKNFAPVVSHIQAMATLVQRDAKWTGPVLDSESAPASARVDAIHAALASPRPAETPKAAEEEPAESEPVVEKPKEEEKVEVAAPVKEEEPVKEAEPEQPTVVEPAVVEVAVIVAEVEAEVVEESKEAEPEVPAVVIVAVVEEAAPVEDEKTSEVASEAVSETTEDREEKEISETAASVVDIVVADLVLEPEDASQQSEEKLDLGSDESEPEKDSPKSEEETSPVAASKADEEPVAEPAAEAPAAAVEAEASAGAATTTSSDGSKLNKVAELKDRSGYIASNDLLVNLAPSGKPMNRVAAQDELLYRVREILEDLDGRKPKTKAIAGRIGVSAAEGAKISHVDSKTWKEDIISGKWDAVSGAHRGLVVISCITEESIPDHVGYPTKDVHRYARDMIEDMLDLAGEDPDLTDLIHADESLFARSTSKDSASLIYVALKSE